MRLDQKSPIFGRVIVPWYDSEAACLAMIVFMVALLWFGILGIWTARENGEFYSWEYIWVPIFIVAASSGVIISTTIRLIKRVAYKFAKQD